MISHQIRDLNRRYNHSVSHQEHNTQLSYDKHHYYNYKPEFSSSFQEKIIPTNKLRYRATSFKQYPSIYHQNRSIFDPASNTSFQPYQQSIKSECINLMENKKPPGFSIKNQITSNWQNIPSSYSSDQQRLLCCFYCKDLLWNPKQCFKCHTHYCATCLQFVPRCLSCQSLLFQQQPDPCMMSQLHQIMLKCIHQGCQTVVSADRYQQHISKCLLSPYYQAQQPSKMQMQSKEQTQQQFQYYELDPHRLKKVRCRHCLKIIHQSRRQSHEKHCDLRLVSCIKCDEHVPLAHIQVHQTYRCNRYLNQNDPLKELQPFKSPQSHRDQQIFIPQ